MPAAPLVPILRQLRRVAAGPMVARSDADLLGRFVRTREEAAFEELIRRHGPIVWGVCTRLLADRHAAEDAFQATFMVLARRAAAVNRPAAVGCWLYGVARRIAGRLRRHAVPGPLPDIVDGTSTTPLDALTARELATLLDDELCRLPDRLRGPLVLCYLEGRTRDEAASALGWSVGTLKRRLEQGRTLLRSRLTRRGVDLSAVLLTAALAEGSATAAMPAGLVATTAGVAATFAVEGVAESVPAALAVAAMRTVVMTKLRVSAVLAAGVVAMTVLITGMTGTDQPGGPESPKRRVVADAAPRTDCYGDPLPAGAIARMGTVRFYHGASFARIAFSPDGRFVAVSSERGNHYFYAATGAPLAVADAVRSGSVSAAGGRLVCADARQDGIYFTEVTTGKAIGRSKGVSGTVYGIALGPDGKAFIVGTYGNPASHHLRFGRVSEEDLSEPVEIGNGRQVWQIVFSADGKTAAILCADGSATVFDVAAQKQLATFPLGPPVANAALSPDGTILAAAVPMEVGLFEARTGKKLRAISDKNGSPGMAYQSAAFSPDGKLLAINSIRTVGLFDPATGKEVRAIRASGGQVFRTAFSPDGRTLAVADEERVMMCDVATGRPRPAPGHTYAVWGFAFAPDGKTIVSGGSYTDRIARVWDPFTGVQRAQWEGHTRGIESVAFAPDCRHAVTGSQDGTARVWDVATNTEVRRLGGKYGMVYGVAVAPDGRTLAAAHVGVGVRLWDLTTGRELRPLDAFPKWTLRVAFAPDGKTLAGYARDGHEAILADVASGAVVRRFAVPAALSCLTFSPDGALLALGSCDGAIRLEDVATGAVFKEIAALSGAQPNTVSWVYSVTFSPDGRTVATGYGDRAVRVWELASGQKRAQFDGHLDAVLHVQYSPDGSLLASSGSDRTILTWDVTGAILAPTRPITTLSPADLAARWVDLAAADAGRAFRAIQALARSSESAVKMMADHLRPAIAVDGQPMAQLLVDLDSPQFALRERADKALTKLGDSAEPSLRKALKGSPSAEARRRITAILERLDPAGSPERLQAIRAVEVLERIGTPEAKRVLDRLAGGTPEARLTREAKAALERLDRQAAK